jgi:uncharacterized protein (TIGR03083 family)
VEITAHIAAIESAGRLLASSAASGSLDARVPSCPDWDMRELVRHQGGIHRWATSIVGTPRTEAWDVDLPEVVGEWPPDDELISWFESGLQTLTDTLTAAPDDLDCWTFLAASSPKAMWARRQAHETTIHRVDAELAAGPPSAIDPQLAADGVDELVSCFITRRGGRLKADPARTLGLTTRDTADSWVLTIGPDGTATRHDAGVDAECVARADAEDLYLALWSRRDPNALEVEGDRAVLDLFLDLVHVRWS